LTYINVQQANVVVAVVVVVVAVVVHVKKME
jgi:hypothetical protein